MPLQKVNAARDARQQALLLPKRTDRVPECVLLREQRLLPSVAGGVDLLQRHAATPL